MLSYNAPAPTKPIGLSVIELAKAPAKRAFLLKINAPNAYRFTRGSGRFRPRKMARTARGETPGLQPDRRLAQTRRVILRILHSFPA